MVFQRKSKLTESPQEKQILKAGCQRARGSVGSSCPGCPGRGLVSSILAGVRAGREVNSGGTWGRWQHLSLVASIDGLKA